MIDTCFWSSLISLCLVQTEGRQLPLEKIILGSTQFQSSPQADWGQQAVKEQVITAVPLRNWMVLYVNRDKSKALDFVTMMNKVTPAMGIEVSVLPSATSKVTTSHFSHVYFTSVVLLEIRGSPQLYSYPSY